MQKLFWCSLLFPNAVFASELKVDTGDTSWVLISTALVLLMTPGLAFFYGGMVHTRHVVSTIFQSFIALGIVGVLWVTVGYSLVFSGDHFGFIGNLNWFMLEGVGQLPNGDYAATIPHQVFMLFQCMFAVITPALITGAFADRIQFKSWMWIVALWSLLIYVPVAHWVWGMGGWIRQLGALDFAGGMVVHMTAGFSALSAAILLKRKVAEPEHPYDTGMVILGTALLWFGWFGFNAGSALGAGGLAGLAFATTFIAASGSMLSWVIVDSIAKGKPTAMGAAIGSVAGLVAITPAAGFVTPGSALLIGLITGAVVNQAIVIIKSKFKLDDTLDVFGCHGIGGLLGTVLTGVFATKTVNPAGADGLIYGNSALLISQLKASLGVALISFTGTFAIIRFVNLITPVVVDDSQARLGLDQTQHGERINSNFAMANMV